MEVKNGANIKEIAHDIWIEHEPYIRKICEYKLQSIPDRIDDCVQ